MDTQNPLSVPFADFSLTYIPLPEDYPILPLTDQQFQPAAYTQGQGDAIYVTIVLPLPGQMSIELPHGISYKESGERDTYKCVLQLMDDVESGLEARLALLKFSINLSDQMSPEGNWEIEVLVPKTEGGEGNEGTLGKVVMDANMLPTFEEKA